MCWNSLPWAISTKPQSQTCSDKLVQYRSSSSCYRSEIWSEKRQSWQAFGSGVDGIIGTEEFGGEKWRWGVTEFARADREWRINSVWIWYRNGKVPCRNCTEEELSFQGVSKCLTQKGTDRNWFDRRSLFCSPEELCAEFSLKMLLRAVCAAHSWALPALPM